MSYGVRKGISILGAWVAQGMLEALLYLPLASINTLTRSLFESPASPTFRQSRLVAKVGTPNTIKSPAMSEVEEVKKVKKTTKKKTRVQVDVETEETKNNPDASQEQKNEVDFFF